MVVDMNLLEPLEYRCYNCETTYQVVSDEEELAVSFCPFCGNEVGEYDDIDEDDDDVDLQGKLF